MTVSTLREEAYTWKWKEHTRKSLQSWIALHLPFMHLEFPSQTSMIHQQIKTQLQQKRQLSESKFTMMKWLKSPQSIKTPKNYC